MIVIINILFQNPGFFQQFADRIYEGGPLAMSLILVSFLMILFLVIRAAMNLKAASHKFRKNISLINQLALIALVIGLFAQFTGLIQIFDAFESLGDVNPAMFAGGLKVTLLAPLFGGLTFLVGRICSFILHWIRKSDLDANSARA
ncbi:MotA/TolQ/ExbB proton channel family protein [Christiangramia portivictoriae]|uniref:MotA/TolQ/ExbB proton channel family protein n=1 Tax=Christiangramia portivictoriae TaxID=326069 RepID=UPI000429DC35|nr:MotA/TolQ/ExbB proton channel family protein [Christiangramia portivictoriae]